MLAEQLEDRRLLAVINWDGGGDGESWHDPLNWDTDSLPTIADDVIIDVPADPQIRIAGADAAAKSLQSAESIALLNFSLTLAEDSDFFGSYSQGIATLAGTGDITLHAGSGIGDGKITGTGSLFIGPDASLTTKHATIDRAVENEGLVNVITTSTATFSGTDFNNEFHNRATGEIRINDGAEFALSGDTPLINEGRISKRGEGLGLLNADLINRGDFDITESELRIRGDGITLSDITVATGGTVSFDGSFDLGPDTELGGPGNFGFFGSGPYDFSQGEFLPTGEIDFNSTTATITIANTMPATATFSRFVRSHFVFNADQTLNSPTLQFGTISGTGTVTLIGDSSVNRSVFTGEASLVVAPDSTLSVFNQATFARPVEVEGELIHRADFLQVNSDLMIDTEGSLELRGDAVVTFDQDGVIRNQGAISKTAGGVAEIRFGGQIVNDGELMIQEGTLDVNSTIESSTSIEVPEAATLHLRAPITFEPGVAFSGAGTIIFQQGAAEVQDLNDVLFLPTGTVSIRGPLIIGNTLPTEVSLGHISGNVTFNADQTLGSISTRTTFDGNGDLTFVGSNTFDRTTFGGTGEVTFAPGSTNQFAASVSLNQATTNEGLLTVNSGTNVLLGGGATWTNALSGRITLSGNANITGSPNNEVFINQGLLVSQGAVDNGIFGSSNSSFDNRGTMRVNGTQLLLGMPTLPSSGTFTISAGSELRTFTTTGDIELIDGGLLTGDGQFTGSLINGGAVAPSVETGTLTIAGNYTQTENGTLAVNVEGVDSGSHDVLSISGSATLAGSLAANISLSFDADPGQTADILTATTVSGSLADNLPTDLTAEFTDNSVRLAVIETNDPNVVRDAVNRAFGDVRQLLGSLANSHSDPAQGIPFLSGNSGTMNDAWGLTDTLTSVGQSTLTELADLTPTLDDLRTSLESLALIVDCIGDCDQDDLLRFTYRPDPAAISTSLTSASLDQTSLAALADGADFDGSIELTAMLQPELQFVFDQSGFYLAPTSNLEIAFGVDANVNADVNAFAAAVESQLEFNSLVNLDSLDQNADQRVTPDEWQIDLTDLNVDYSVGGGSASIDLELEQLDYVDVLPAETNSDNGGDPFRFRASSTLIPSTPEDSTLAFSWSSVDLVNPDLDGDGTDDFTSAVLAENMRLLTQDVIRGGRTELGNGIATSLSELPLLATGGTFDDATDLAGSIADFLVTNTEIVDVVDFNTVETWLNTGIPDQVDEIVRLQTDLVQIPLQVEGSTTVDPNELLPGVELTGATAGIGNANLSGQLVFGFDTSAEPFYLLISPDDVSSQASELSASVDLTASVDSLRVGSDLLELTEVNALARPTATFAFDSGDDAKLRLSKLGTATVTVSADIEGSSETMLASRQLRLFPNEDSSHVYASADLVSGSIDRDTLATQLSAARVSVGIGRAIEVVSNDISLTFDPSETNSDATLATVGSATIRFPEYPNLPSIDLDGLTIRRDGFSMDSFATPIAEEDLPPTALASLAGEGEEVLILRGRVWLDSDGDHTATGEFGVAGQTVRLFNAIDDALVDETATDEQGEYGFAVDPGAYYVEFGLTSQTTVFVTPDQGSESVDSDVVDGARTRSFVVANNESNIADAGIRNTIERPVLIVPGIVGTGAKDVRDGDNYMNWLLHRGIHPDHIESDPLTRVYDDLFQTLDNVGYTPNEDLFVVTYDWRLLPGPEDGVIDGRINGLTAQNLIDEEFTFGVDYLGYFMEQAAQAWKDTHGSRPESVDIIAHSTGGLVTRAYIQSDAYPITDSDGNRNPSSILPNGESLPKINNFIGMGVPHRGASKAWNPLHNNVATDTSFRFVVSKMIHAALLKLQKGETIKGPSGLIDGEDAITLEKLQAMDGDLETNFIRAYVPTTKALLATFDFLTDQDGNPVNINTNSDFAAERNVLALDLNAGLDQSLIGDPNAFVDNLKGSLIVIAGTSEETLREVRTRVGEDLVTLEFPTTHESNQNPVAIAGMSEFLLRPANPGEVWFEDITRLNGGDGTVPIVSSLGQFQTDVARLTSGKIILAPLDEHESEPDPGHLPLMHIPRSQRTVLAALGQVAGGGSISQGLAKSNLDLALSIPASLGRNSIGADREVHNIVSLLLDPIGSVLIDGNGSRILGYDADSDQVIEVEGTAYLGGADGLGLVFGDFEGPFTVEVTGVDGDGRYAVGAEFAGNRIGGFFDEGTLGTGEQFTLDVPTIDVLPNFGIDQLLEVSGLTIAGQGINVVIGTTETAIEGTISIAAEQAALLPDITTEALDGLVTVEGFVGSIDLATAAFSLSADQATLAIEDVVTATASSQGNIPGISFTFDPDDSDQNTPIASVNNVQLDFPLFGEIDTELLKLQSLAIRRDGFDLVTEIGGDGIAASIGQSPRLLEVDGLTIQTDLHVLIDADPSGFLSNFVVAGSITANADSAVLLPDSATSMSVTDDDAGDDLSAVTGILETQTGKFQFDLRKLEATVAGVIDIQVDPDDQTPAVSFDFDPDAVPTDQLIRFGSLDASITALEFDGLAPSVQLQGFSLRNDGSPFVDSGSVTLPDGYLGRTPIGNLLPFEFSGLSLDFPDPNDLDSLTLAVEGDFNLDELQAGLRSLLSDSVTPTVTVGSGAPGSVAFDLAIDSLATGQISPLNLGPITIGLSGLEVGSLTLDGSLTWGGLVDGVVQTDVSGSFDFVTSDPDDPFAGLSFDVLPTSSLITTDDGVIVDVDARITFDGDFTGQIGGVDVAGTTVELSFLLETSATSVAPFIVFDRASVEFVSVTIDEIDFEIPGFARVFSDELSVFNPGQAAGQIADVDNVTIDFLGAFDSLGTASVDGLALFDDRVEFENGVLAIPGTLGDGSIFDFTNLELFTTDFVFDFDTGPIGLGSIGLRADEASLLGEATIASPRLEIGLNRTALEFSAASLMANLDDLVEIQTGPLAVEVSDTANVIASVVAATITLPQIKQAKINPDDADQPLSFDINGTEQNPGLVVRRDGFDIASLTHTPFDFEIDDIVKLEQLQVTLTDLSFDVGTGFRETAAINVHADDARLFPDDENLIADLTNVDLFYRFDASGLQTSVGELDLEIGRSETEEPLVDIDASGLQLDLTGGNEIITLPAATILLPRVRNEADEPFRMVLPETPGTPALVIRRDGFDIASLNHTPFDFNIDGLVSMTGVQVTPTNVSYRIDSGFASGSTLTVTATSVDLLDGNSPLDGPINGFELTVDLSNGSIEVDADSMVLSFGVIDFQDVTFGGAITAGNLAIGLSGRMLFDDIKVGSGAQPSPLSIDFIATIDSDEITLGGGVDLAGQEVGIGDASNRLISFVDLAASVNLTIPLPAVAVTGGLNITAVEAIITPGLPINARVTGTPANPAIDGSLDFATGAIDLDLFQFNADLGGVITLAGNPVGVQPAARLTFDPAAIGTSQDLIRFASLTAGLPLISDQITGTLTDFGFRHDGTAFLSGASFSGIGDALSDLGIPEFITIDELGLSSADGGALTSDDLVHLNFQLTVSGGIDLNNFGVPLVGAVEGMTIDVSGLTGGNLMPAIAFQSIEVAVQDANGNPVSIGPLTIGGTFKLEQFDPTPDDNDDADSIMIRVAASVQFAGISGFGLAGEFLITEYGPIAMGLDLSVPAVPLGPVTMFSAGVYVAFNEAVPDLPEKCDAETGVCQPDPLALIAPPDPTTNQFNLSRFRRGNQDLLIEQAEENARDFIIQNRQREANNQPPISVLESPVLVAISGTFGPSGQTADTSVLTVDATIGVNFSLQADDPGLVLFGIGEAFVGNDDLGVTPLALGTVGAVLELTDPLNPEFQFAFATPSPPLNPGSTGPSLSDQIPAEVNLAASFVKEGDVLMLRVEGNVNILDVLQAEAFGDFTLNESGLFGRLDVKAEFDGEDSSIDLSKLGADDLELVAALEFQFNLTPNDETISRVVSVDGENQTRVFDLPAMSTRLVASGTLNAGGFEVAGAFLFQNDPDQLLVSAFGEINLGDLGRLQAEGGISFIKERRNQSQAITQAGGAAGFLEISVDINTSIVSVAGGAAFQFNTLEQQVPIEVPQADGSTRIETIESGPFFRVLIAGLDNEGELDEQGLATLTIFPGSDLLSISLGARVDLEIRDEPIGDGKIIDLHAAGSVDVTAFGILEVSGQVEANLFLSSTDVYGSFRSDLINADLDRFGCLHVDGLGNFGNCAQRIFIDDHVFDEDSGDRSLLVQLTTPAIQDLRVRLGSEFSGGLQAQEDVHYELLGQEDQFGDFIIIPAGATSGQFPIRIIDDGDTPSSDRGRRLFPVGRYLGGSTEHPRTEKIGSMLIRDDDTPPIGPSVEVAIEPQKLDDDGNISEADGSLKLRVRAAGLQSVDTVSLLVTVSRTSAASESVSDDFGGEDSNVFRARFPIEIQGSRPYLIDIPVINDNIAEIGEQFEVEFDLVRDARFAPSTSLIADPFTFKILNDDPERPENAVLFYSFEGETKPAADGTVDYEFSSTPDFTAGNLSATPIRSGGVEIVSGVGVEKLEPGAPFDLQTPGASRSGWTTPSGQRSWLVNGTASAGLNGWRQARGGWSTVNVSTFDRAFVTQASFSINDFRLDQFVELDEIAHRITLGGQAFILKGNIKADNGATGRLEVNFLDESNRSVGLIASDDVSGGRLGRNVTISDVIPRDALTAVIRLVAKNAGASPVLFDHLTLETGEPSYIEFDVLLDDADVPITPDNADQLLAVHFTGIDFWDSGTQFGPRGWELRWSDDDYASVVARGRTHLTNEARHQDPTGFDVRAIRPINEPVTFRLYGFAADSADGIWSVDNLALIGTVDTIDHLPVSPVAVDDEFLLVGADADNGVTLVVGSNDFDPNRDGRRIIDVSQPLTGAVEIQTDSGGLSANNITYTRTDPNATADSFTYTISDRSGQHTGTSTATVTLNFFDRPPVFEYRYLAVAGEVLDVDETEGLLSKHDFNQFPDARVEIFTPPTLADEFALNKDGSFTLTPRKTLDVGSGFVFTYQILVDHPLIDGEVLRSFTGPVVIQIDNADARRAIDDVFSTDEDTTIKQNVLNNDAQGFGDPLKAILISQPRLGPGSEFMLSNDGEFTYRPPANFFGSTSFSYTIAKSVDETTELEKGFVTIHVAAVNDHPTAFSRTVTLPGDQEKAESIVVTGSDGQETAAFKLIASLVKKAKLGTVIQTGPGSRTFRYTPPTGGLGSKSDSFTFVVIDEDGAQSAMKTVTIQGDGKSSGKTSKGKGSNSHIEGGVVWLEVNGTGKLDKAIIDQGEQIEPSTNTRADGSFLLSIPDPFDPNDNGQIDPDEGRLYLNGGRIVATGSPVRYPLKAHGDSGFITPLTTLLVSLTDAAGLPREIAEQRLIEAFNLPPIDLLNTDILQRTLDGQPNTLPAYIAGVQVIDTVTTVARAIDGMPLFRAADQVYATIAALITLDSDDFDLSDEDTITNILVEANGRTGNTIDDKSKSALTQVIVDSNRRLSDLPPIAGSEVLAQIARIEKIVQFDLYAAVRSLVAGELTGAQLTEQFAGDALTAKIDAAVIGNVRIPALSVDDIFAPSTNDSAEFVVRLSEPSTKPVIAQYTTVDETLLADNGDYTASNGMLTFAAGETEKVVSVPFAGTTGTFSLFLTSSERAILFDALGTAMILPPTGDNDGVDDTIEFAAPNGGDANHDGMIDMQQDNVASFVDISSGSYITAVSEKGFFVAASTGSLPTDIVPAGTYPATDAIDLTLNSDSESAMIEILLEQPIAANQVLAAIGDADALIDFGVDGNRGAELLDSNNDGFVESIRVHWDRQTASPKQRDVSTFAIRLLPVNNLSIELQTIQIVGTERPDLVQVHWNETEQKVTITVNDQVVEHRSRDEVDRIDIQTLGGHDKIIATPDLPIPLFIDAGTGSDLIYAGAGDDQIFGGQGKDKIFSRGGNDTIDGGDNSDLISAGDGDDKISAGHGQDVVFGGSGDDQIDGGGNRDVLSGQGGNDTIDGGDAPDRLFGGDGNDLMRGGPGRDAIYGGKGDDDLRGGDDDDTIYSGSGNDSLQGGAGNDLLVGGRDIDRIFGGAGNDKLYGSAGNDAIFAGSGNDFAQGGFGDDVIQGEAGDDHLRGNQGNDRLVGGPGEDSLIGGLGENILIGDPVSGERFPEEAIEVQAPAPVSSTASGDPSLFARDVNGDGRISALDALIVINRLARAGEGSIELTDIEDERYDTNGDDRVSARDALVIINQLATRKEPELESSDLIELLEGVAPEVEPAKITALSTKLSRVAYELATATSVDPDEHDQAIGQLVAEFDKLV